MSQDSHWENVYGTKPADQLGWYVPHIHTSIEWTKGLGMVPEARIIDVGGGASTFVDDMISEGFKSISVLDISASALTTTRIRLGDLSGYVTWIDGDIATTELPEHHFDLWHDRAMFHFLTSQGQRAKYVDCLLKSLKPNGHLILALFAPEAPPSCSGLPVQRYSSDQLEKTLGDDFELQRHTKELHVTPGGVEQMYLYCLFRRVGI